MLEPAQVAVDLVARNEAGSDPAGDRPQLTAADQCSNVVLGAAELDGKLANCQGRRPLHTRSIACGTALSRLSTIGRMAEFIPPDFDAPLGLETSEFVLEPLGTEHNDRDYDAWTSSMEHIAATPGYPDGSWPREMTRDENRADLQRHSDDFRNRKGFTYTVLDSADRAVIGCVYIYPLRDTDHGAAVLSWVRRSHAHLDIPLWRAVSRWLESDWPFARIEYPARAS